MAGIRAGMRILWIKLGPTQAVRMEPGQPVLASGGLSRHPTEIHTGQAAGIRLAAASSTACALSSGQFQMSCFPSRASTEWSTRPCQVRAAGTGSQDQHAGDPTGNGPASTVPWRGIQVNPGCAWCRPFLPTPGAPLVLLPAVPVRLPG
jgi:hypothetical protein